MIVLVWNLSICYPYPIQVIHSNGGEFSGFSFAHLVQVLNMALWIGCDHYQELTVYCHMWTYAPSFCNIFENNHACTAASKEESGCLAHGTAQLAYCMVLTPIKSTTGDIAYLMTSFLVTSPWKLRDNLGQREKLSIMLCCIPQKRLF